MWFKHIQQLEENRVKEVVLLEQLKERIIMFERILVALNTEESYAPIFDRALALAAATKAELYLLGVVDRSNETALPLLAYPGITGYPVAVSEKTWADYEENYKKLKARGERILSELTKEAIAAGVKATFVQQVGDVGDTICDRAQTLQADLVIVGSHGRRGLNELLMGSVSSYVMHRAPCSVMVVHNKAQEEKMREEEESATTDGLMTSRPKSVAAI